ncbi:ATP-binding cassette domain-containing protein [Vibrio breoganii]|uniref:ABC transporter ATP-binding protein n=1 Tax=Vibrio breoganii TaxID=553239 RepID=A0AAP8SVH6_9VIBR|nr:energy-coupling factor ABC transporter ATP-binding protein [Vibrio breoganii]MDN3714754.1 energy-coupling factor ABC transporter ATP-binding protein [Vibrio breoganii]OCH73001.1 ABC transporter ATP-binding protein [Vibrio breoganii]OED90076.1 ABC transporter ATP-binding protein [Vibrio breoganii ZF-55]OED93610.1 ABC transporter ATP-binding protein [Vibrio breoganii ZF-29]OEF83242.1 ABC transporter ATP-binding protein [Vibrio breoganii 1C10]
MSIQLRAQDLSKRYDDRVLFHIPSLTLGPSDAIYLKGHNGVGKTTLLKILAGLTTPSSGTINGNEISTFHRLFKRKLFRDVVYLHQSPYMFDASLVDNIRYALPLTSQQGLNSRTRAIHALRQVGLESLADEHCSVLSGGEKQRLAMARAWIVNPSILLMDEPSASLDLESTQGIVSLAKDLLDRGSSIVITSHQQNGLTNLCDTQWSIENQGLTVTPHLRIIDEEIKHIEPISHNISGN